jgi:hypothetical protein
MSYECDDCLDSGTVKCESPFGSKVWADCHCEAGEAVVAKRHAIEEERDRLAAEVERLRARDRLWGALVLDAIAWLECPAPDQREAGRLALVDALDDMHDNPSSETEESRD